MAWIDQFQNDASYVLLGPFGAYEVPTVLAMTGGGRGEPSTTLERAPGSAVPFALGDGIRALLPVTFSGELFFDTEAEKDLHVAQAQQAAQEATFMERYEKSGPLGTAPGWVSWRHGKKATSGTLTLTLYPSARPTIGGILVDW